MTRLARFVLAIFFALVITAQVGTIAPRLSAPAEAAIVILGPTYHPAPAGGGFIDPSSVPGLEVWLSDTGASAGTWPDISGNGRDAVQATSSKQPSIVAGAVNGHQVRRADAIDDFLRVTVSVAQPCTVIFVGRERSKGGGGYGVPIASQANGAAIGWDPSDNLFLYGSTGFQFSGARDVGGTHHVYSALASPGSGQLYLDGASVGTGTTNFAITTSLVIGSNDAGSYFAWDFAEILVYSSALTSTDRHNVEAWLGTKYAIAIAP